MNATAWIAVGVILLALGYVIWDEYRRERALRRHREKFWAEIDKFRYSRTRSVPPRSRRDRKPRS